MSISRASETHVLTTKVALSTSLISPTPMPAQIAARPSSPVFHPDPPLAGALPESRPANPSHITSVTRHSAQQARHHGHPAGQTRCSAPCSARHPAPQQQHPEPHDAQAPLAHQKPRPRHHPHSTQRHRRRNSTPIHNPTTRQQRNPAHPHLLMPIPHLRHQRKYRRALLQPVTPRIRTLHIQQRAALAVQIAAQRPHSQLAHTPDSERGGA